MTYIEQLLEDKRVLIRVIKEKDEYLRVILRSLPADDSDNEEKNEFIEWATTYIMGALST